MRPSPIGIVAAAVLALVAGAAAAPGRAAAQARVPDEPIEKDEWPSEIVRRPLTLAEGMLELAVPVGVNLSISHVSDPVNVAPTAYYGISDSLTVGVRHLLGLCFTGGDGCPRTYNDLGVDTLWRLRRFAGADWALGLALDAAPLTGPFTLAGEARLVARWAGGPFALVLAPTLDVGLTQRSNDRVRKRVGIAFPLTTYPFGVPIDVPGNREVLTVPASLQVQVLPPLAVVFGAAFVGLIDPPVGSFGDTYLVPVGVAAVVSPTNRLDLGASFTFPNLFGKSGPDLRRADVRAMQVFAALRM